MLVSRDSSTWCSTGSRTRAEAFECLSIGALRSLVPENRRAEGIIDAMSSSPEIPFRPVQRDFPGHEMPATVPAGMKLELSRSRIVPGREGEFDEWMQMLTDRYDESVEALPAERSVFEATFRHVESDGSTWIYHLALVGEEGSGLDESNSIDADHAEYSRRVKEPGWEELEPRFMLTPDHLRDAMQQWALTGRIGASQSDPG